MKNVVKQGVYNGISIAPMIGLGSFAYNSLDLRDKAMQLIAQQFDKAGASYSIDGTTIKNPTFPINSFVFEDGEWALKNKMDFSGVPALYTEAGELGFKIALASELIGGIAGLIAGRKANPEINGLIKTGRRMGTAYGLGQTLAARIGLENMPYKQVTDLPGLESEYSLVEISKDSISSSVDISPLVSDGINYLNTLFGIGLGVGIGIEVACELNEYLKNRTPTKALKDFDKKELNV